MKTLWKRLTGIGTATVLSSSLTLADPASATATITEASATITVTTYNMLSTQYDENYPGITWQTRRHEFAKIIRQPNNDPDILAIQEGQERPQVDDLTTMLGRGYENFTAPQDISPRAIIWKDAMFDRLDAGVVELLDPSVEGYAKQRYGTWVRLEHLRTGQQLMVLTIHVPTGAAEELHELRYHAALAMADHVKQWSEQYGDIPVILLGDFNSYYETVIGGYQSGPKLLSSLGIPEAYAAAPPESRTNPDYQSYLALNDATTKPGANGTRRLDYIHTYPADRVEVLDWRMIINFRDGSDTDLRTPVPSDHHPTAASLRLSWS